MKEKSEIKILIVDDVQKNVQVLGTLLKNEHYSLVIAQNGKEAIERAVKIKPDIILLDINMPGMDGIEVCRVLKESVETKEVPVIFLTAQNTTISKVKGFTVGAADYIEKPYDPAELLARVATHLEIKFSREQIAKDSKLKATLKAHGILAHEVYNPLTAIMGNLDMMRMMVESGSINKDKLSTFIKRSLEGCQSIVEKVESLKSMKDKDIDEIHDGFRFKKNV
ncbi:MAG: response regulator [Bdellovibrionota bacterium]|nr:response regulator [Bdellovibrionota bacterium]|tara:strand:+ start:7964 stop:8635 length:672 start_codon:yes stop_codon:yes gene_type:complete